MVEVEEALGTVLVVEGSKTRDGPVHIHGVGVEGTVPSQQQPVGEGATEEHLEEGWGRGKEGGWGLVLVSSEAAAHSRVARDISEDPQEGSE